MDTYLVIWTDAEGVTHASFLSSDTPESSSPAAWELADDAAVVATVDVAESAVESIFIDEAQVHPALPDADPAAEHAEAGAGDGLKVD